MSQSVLYNILNKIISNHGKDILKNDKMFISLFCDYCAADMTERNNIKTACELGIIKNLVAASDTTADATSIVKNAIETLKSKAKMNESIARSLVCDVADILNLRYTKPTPPPPPIKQTPTTSPAKTPSNTQNNTYSSRGSSTGGYSSSGTSTSGYSSRGTSTSGYSSSGTSTSGYSSRGTSTSGYSSSGTSTSGYSSSGTSTGRYSSGSTYKQNQSNTTTTSSKKKSVELPDRVHAKFILPVFLFVTALMLITFIENARQIYSFSGVFSNYWKEFFLFIAWYSIIFYGFTKVEKYSDWNNFWIPAGILAPILLLVLGGIFINKGFFMSLLIALVRLLPMAIAGFFGGAFISALIPDSTTRALSRLRSNFIMILLYGAAVVALVSVVPVVFNNIDIKPDWQTSNSNLSFVLNDDGSGYTVNGIGSETSEEIVIPDTYKRLPVTAIGDYAFYSREEIMSVSIPDSVTTIGDNAFYGCSSLSEVNMGNSVNTIGNNAFYGCASLIYVSLPDSVTSLGMGAFCECSNLFQIYLGNSLQTISQTTFVGCTALQSIYIPDSVTLIEQSAFSGCKSLQEVIIGSSVRSIDDFAFSNCTSLLNVVVNGNSLTEIKYGAFSTCSSLQNISLPKSLNEINVSAFMYCPNLSLIEFSGTVSEWKNLHYYGDRSTGDFVVQCTNGKVNK